MGIGIGMDLQQGIGIGMGIRVSVEHYGLSRAIPGFLGQSRAISGYLELSQAIISEQGRKIWIVLGYSAPTRYILAFYPSYKL